MINVITVRFMMICFFGKTILKAEEKCQKSVKDVSTTAKSREIVCSLHQL